MPQGLGSPINAAIGQRRPRERSVVPERVSRVHRPPWTHIQIRLGVGGVTGRCPIGGPGDPLGLGIADLDRNVEVAGPQLHAAGIGCAWSAAQLFQRRGGHTEPVADERHQLPVHRQRAVEIAQCHGVVLGLVAGGLDSQELGRRAQRGDRFGVNPVAVLHHQEIALHPHLGVIAEERGAEAAQSPAQAELTVGRLAGVRNNSVGQPVEVVAPHRIVIRHSQQPPVVGQPSGLAEIGHRLVGGGQIGPKEITRAGWGHHPGSRLVIAAHRHRVVGKPGSDLDGRWRRLQHSGR